MSHLTDLLPRALSAGGAWMAAIGVALLLAACDGAADGGSGAATQAPRRVTFMAGFKPQANLPFVGVYVAQDKGFFRAQGLEVEIKHAQAGEHMQLLVPGSIHFSTADASAVLRRIVDPGLEVQSIALIGQKGQQGFAALERSGIVTPGDWAGKTLGYKGSVPPEFYAIAKAVRLDPSRVNLVRVGFDPRILSEGQVDVLAVFMSNEPHTLERLGFRTRVFDPNDYGVPLLGLTYIATNAFVAREPDAVARFVRAAIQGIEYADANRAEALDIVMRYARDEDREHQRFMMETELARAKSDLTAANGIGWQTREQWERLMRALVEFQALEKPVDVSQAFTNRFVELARKSKP